MKISALLSAILICFSCVCQSQPLVSKVYHPQGKGINKKIFSGSGTLLSVHQMKLVSLRKGKLLTCQEALNGNEHFFIIKDGPVKVNLGGTVAELNRGSVITVLSGDKLTIENIGESTASIYEMTYRSIEQPDNERGKKAGGSFMMNWNDMVFKPHNRGGVRQLFDRPTTMLNRFDIHVTTLNEGFKSHDPHTHKNDEIILMLEGNAEMQIGTDHQKANAGDVVYLSSMVLHNLTNVGKTPCLYFAIQWN